MAAPSCHPPEVTVTTMYVTKAVGGGGALCVRTTGLWRRCFAESRHDRLATQNLCRANVAQTNTGRTAEYQVNPVARFNEPSPCPPHEGNYGVLKPNDRMRAPRIGGRRWRK